jgi:putative transport protein
MHWFVFQPQEHVELALFLSLAVGCTLGKIRVGTLRVGAELGTLIAGLVIGQVGVTVPNGMRIVFFLMFLFATGYRIRPQFFRGLKSSALRQVGLSVLLRLTGLGLT